VLKRTDSSVSVTDPEFGSSGCSKFVGIPNFFSCTQYGSKIASNILETYYAGWLIHRCGFATPHDDWVNVRELILV